MIHDNVPAARMVNKSDEVDPANYKVNFNKIQRLLDYRPSWTVQRGIEQVIQAIQKGEIADYKETKFSNIKFFAGQGLALLDRHENGWAGDLLDETLEEDLRTPITT
jgi:hypothetical protein